MKNVALFVFCLVLGSSALWITTAKAEMLMGFLDGAGLWNSQGVQLYTCFPDQTCLGLDNQIYSKSVLLGNNPVDNSYVPPAPVTQPVSQPVTPVATSPSTPPISTPTLLPPYTKSQLGSLTGCQYGCMPNLNITSTSVEMAPTSIIGGPTYSVIASRITMTLDGVTVFQNGKGQTPDGLRDYFEVDNLTPGTSHDLIYIYTESGREDTVIDFPFTTPNQ